MLLKTIKSHKCNDEFVKRIFKSNELIKEKVGIDKQLLFEYNQNTAGWGWGETGFKIPPEKDTNRVLDAEALPFDLPIPDYRQLHSSC